MTTRRIIPTNNFPDSLTALGPTARTIVDGLADYLIRRPHGAPALDGSTFHVLHTRSYGEYPALRIIYKFDDEAVYLMDVDLYDELQTPRV